MLFIPIFLAFSNPIVLKNDGVALYFIDLPDGEATLIKTSDDHFSLINTGSLESRAHLADAITDLNVNKIDYLIVTEHDPAYSANTDWVLDHYQVNHYYDITDTNQVGQTLKTGDRYPLSPLLTFHVLKVNSEKQSSTNLLTYRDQAILFLGRTNFTKSDISLTKDYHVRAIKIAHFAIQFAPEPAVLKKLNPDFAIIFALKNRVANHDLLSYLTEQWVDVYQLEFTGSLMLVFFEDKYELFEEFKLKNPDLLTFLPKKLL